MSACGEFAEHVWKPGSCKNCFHPRSAHRPSGSAPCVRASLGGDEDDGVTLPSPYSKPTIAVRPTMMNLDANEMLADVNMNIKQENPKSPVDRHGLKKMLDFAPLYIDSNGCNKAMKEAVLQNTVPGKMDFSSRFSPSAMSPPPLPKESMIISSIFVTQEEGRGSHSLKENGNSTEPYRQQITRSIKSSTYNGNSVVTRGSSSTVQELQAPLGIAINIIATAPSNGINSGHTEPPPSTSPASALTLDSRSPGPQPCGRTPSFLSEPASPSDSCSYRSSTDSLTGPEGFGQLGLDSPRSRPGSASASSPSDTPNGQPNTSEPIYAESTKRKRRPNSEGKPSQHQRSELEVEVVGEGQRAKITVMAAHTEENNRTFYLSSPDSAVSTQWPHFSPTLLKDPSSPTFKWPTSSSCTGTEMPPQAFLQPKPQGSPPIPPKRNNRSPRLGTSSLSPAALPEATVHAFLLSPRDNQVKPQVETHTSAPERRHKPHNTAWNWEGRIEEEEEGETEEGTAQETASRSRVTGLINGAAVWRESRDWRPAAHSEGSTPPGTTNNGASQKQAGSSEEEGKHSGSMLAKTTSSRSTDLTEGKSANHDPTPPPPPPKKHHRVSAKMSQSTVELDRCSQQGSMESLTKSLRGLGSSSLLTASTDSLHNDSSPSSRAHSDTGSQDAPHLSCSSPYPRSPLASSPGSPYPDPFSSNSLGNQLQPPPLPEKKLVNRTVSAPASAPGKPLVRTYPRLPFTGSESNVCRPAGSQSSLPSSPVDPRPLFSSSESLERCHAPQARPLRSRTLDEPLKTRGRLGAHCRGSMTTSSSPQLSVPFSASGLSAGSSLQLQTLLSNMDSREGIYSKLGGLYAESLRRLALKCEDHFTRSQKNPLRFDESNWSLFKLTCNKPSCNAGDAVYYSAACASDPSNSYAVKICKSQTAEVKQGHLYGLSVQQSMPPHFNLQQDCGHFIACVPQSMLPSEEASLPPCPSASQGDKERVVVITREVPQQSASDFVREWASFHQAQPEVYERRVCFLLLQLCNGLEHLKEHGVTHRDLCLENLLLAPHRRHGHDQKHLPRLLVSSFAKSKRRSAEDSAAANDPRLKRDHARLAPEIVSAAQYRKFDEFQTGILIYELLHQPNPFEVSPKLKEQDYSCEDLPAIPGVSLYSAGLQRLARLLLQPDPIKRIHIQEAKRMLQSLLWGPRRELMEQQWDRPGEPPRHEGLLNWLDVKRALLMMKFAERSLEPERNAELEDWLCCQYFSSAHPLSLCHTAELLYSLK